MNCRRCAKSPSSACRTSAGANGPVAVVVLADGAALELPDLTDHCRQHLAAFKVPKQLIIRDQSAAQSIGQGAQARVARRTRGQRMTQAPATAAAGVTKLNRAERNAWTKRKIFDAATRIVGKYGYAEASVARITEEAGVAQGTFYNHFENRQELLDQLLPKIGMDMVQFIRDRTGTARRGETGDHAVWRLLRLHPRGPGIPAHSQRGRVLRADRLPEASRQHFDGLCPNPETRASCRRDRGLQRRGVRGHRSHVHGRARATSAGGTPTPTAP